MPAEPTTKNCIAFFDGQNLYRSAKDAYGYHYPNYDPLALAKAVCSVKGWALTGTRFYTGVPEARHSPTWHKFWSQKKMAMTRMGVYVYTRILRYQESYDASGSLKMISREKGIDVRIAIDVIRMARKGDFDVALLFSQDQDLSEVADEIKSISTEKNRWIKMASAYPWVPHAVNPDYNRRGVNNTEWIKIDKLLYDRCLDPTDYRI